MGLTVGLTLAKCFNCNVNVVNCLISYSQLTGMQSLPQGKKMAESAQDGKNARHQPNAICCYTLGKMWNCKDLPFFQQHECNIACFPSNTLT